MNISIIIYVILMSIGQAISWLIAQYQQAQFKVKQLTEREKILMELSAAKKQIMLSEHWRKEYEICEKELCNLRDVNALLKADLREATTQLESIRLHEQNKTHEIIDNEKQLKEQFENTVNRIFEDNKLQINEQNHQNLNSLLIPLREQLDSFYRQIINNFTQEANERHTLAYEIRNLQKLNNQIAKEAFNLTRVLKGDNKIQGNWGEIVLKRVLELSGLREGYEYETQVNIETDTHSRMQPDVIIRLPQEKDVIIDSKMSLVAYERYFNAEDDCTRNSSLKEHIASFRNHIKHLGRKDYQRLPGLRTLDYVLMFVPVEPALLLAIDKQPELINEALQNNIMLVSPTTLLIALRTVVNLWRYDHQSRNAQQIADRASKLYDKMRLFIEEMLSIGQSLNHAQENYLQAMKKLTSGRGNLLSQIESFRSLGVNIKREINPELVEKATLQNEDCYLFNVHSKSECTYKKNVSEISSISSVLVKKINF